MCPQEAKVFLLEDLPESQEMIIEHLEDAGHIVALQAGTYEEAITALSQFDKCHINVAVLDRNLDPDDDKNMDGEFIGEMIREKYPDVIIVGNSSKGISCAHMNNFSKGSSSLTQLVTNA